MSPWEYPADPECPSCDGRGWYAEADGPAGDLIDKRCPCWERVHILGPQVVNDDWSLRPHTHKWIWRETRTYCYWCHEEPA